MTDAVQIAYTALAKGTPVRSGDGQSFGTVGSVLVDEAVDVFDGIIVTTEGGARFVDAPFVGRIFTTYVETTLTSAQVTELPEPDGSQFRRLRPGDRVGGSLLRRLLGPNR